MTHRIATITLVILASLIAGSCSSIKEMSNSLANLQKVQFRLKSADNFAAAGVKFTSSTALSSLKPTDALAITSAWAQKKMPVSFMVNVEAKNPNDGTQGRSSEAVVERLEWTLLIDDVETVSGATTSPITVPGSGQTAMIPINVQMDVYQYVQNKGVDGLINLGKALTGAPGSAARLKLVAQPTVRTPIGPISYPGKLTIVDQEFRSK